MTAPAFGFPNDKQNRLPRDGLPRRFCLLQRARSRHPDPADIHVDEVSWRTPNARWEQYDHDVIKPLVGANADDAFWLRTDSPPEILQHVETIFQGRTALAQPFIDSVVSFGEISLIFFAGKYGHSVLKCPRSGDFRVQEEHGGVIRSYEPEDRILELARRSLQAVPEPTLYTRVDVVLLPDHSPAMMELETIEPSLYLSYDSESPTRFADAIEKLLRE